MRQAEAAFAEVERAGRGDGAVNIARVALREGRLDDASAALVRAAKAPVPAYPWSVTWFTAMINKQNGRFDEAIANLRDIVGTNFAEARKREFDFGSDYFALNELAQSLFERAKQERGADRKDRRDALLREAAGWFEKTIALDREDVTAHYGLSLVYAALGDDARAAKHRALHDTYKPDDNARDSTVALHRSRYPAANHAAEAVVIYDLQRADRYTGDVGPILQAPAQVAATSGAKP